MNPADARAAWVAALRSDRFRQTTGALERNGAQCCLGVACRVAIENGVDITVAPGLSDSVAFSGADAVLPEAVQGWLGLATAEGDLSKEATSLVGANDDLGLSFAQIADLIETGRVRLA